MILPAGQKNDFRKKDFSVQFVLVIKLYIHTLGIFNKRFLFVRLVF